MPPYPLPCTTGYELTLRDSLTWSDLWDPVSFFTEYKHYVTVAAIAGSPADRVAYEGLVESSVRQLVLSLQNEIDVAFAIPFPKVRSLRHSCHSCQRCPFGLGSRNGQGYHTEVEAAAEAQASTSQAPTTQYCTTWYIAIHFGDRAAMVDGVPGPVSSPSLDLAGPARLFYEKIQWKQANMSQVG